VTGSGGSGAVSVITDGVCSNSATLVSDLLDVMLTFEIAASGVLLAGPLILPEKCRFGDGVSSDIPRRDLLASLLLATGVIGRDIVELLAALDGVRLALASSATGRALPVHDPYQLVLPALTDSGIVLPSVRSESDFGVGIAFGVEGLSVIATSPPELGCFVLSPPVAVDVDGPSLVSGLDFFLGPMGRRDVNKSTRSNRRCLMSEMYYSGTQPEEQTAFGGCLMVGRLSLDGEQRSG
jgi:hypothetical protein